MMKPVYLSDKAKEHEAMFTTMGLLNRNEEKYQQGLRTKKRNVPYKDWCEYRRKYGADFLVSTYVGGTYCIVTTPTAQYGYLTEEMANTDVLLHSHRNNANDFSTVIDGDRMTHYSGKDAEAIANVPGIKLHLVPDAKRQVVHIHEDDTTPEVRGDIVRNGLVFIGKDGMIASASPIDEETLAEVKKVGGEKLTPFEVVAMTEGNDESPPWADMVLGEDGKRLRVNPELLQMPVRSDALLIAYEHWNSLPDSENWGGMMLLPEPHPNSRMYLFQRCRLRDGTEVVLVDTEERARKYSVPTEVKDGQHRTRIK
jgi:hypothetical protein